jgi:Effector-associated domain 11
MQQNWQLVSDVRTRLFYRWGIPAVLTTGLVLLQTVMGRYEYNAVAWIWVLIGLLPGTILLFGSTWLNKYPAKLVSPGSVRAIRIFLLLHPIVMLLTLLLMPLVVYDLTPEDYLKQSYWWLLATNALVVAGLYALFVKKESRLIPNAQIITAVAEEEAAKARKNNFTHRLQCLELIAANDINGAFEQMKVFFNGRQDDENHLIMLQRRYANITQQRSMGLVEDHVAQIEVNRITEALLNLTKDIK